MTWAVTKIWAVAYDQCMGLLTTIHHMYNYHGYKLVVQCTGNCRLSSPSAIIPPSHFSSQLRSFCTTLDRNIVESTKGQLFSFWPGSRTYIRKKPPSRSLAVVLSCTEYTNRAHIDVAGVGVCSILHWVCCTTLLPVRDLLWCVWQEPELYSTMQPTGACRVYCTLWWVR